ncbi:MAG: Hsp70 family protein [Phycisphaeraceae bacterium]|nr:Hsp70 family protein [Phycisphaeraceae bacterium]
MQRLKEAAEKAKIELSASQETDGELPSINMATAGGPKRPADHAEPAKFESLCVSFDRLRAVRVAAHDAGAWTRARSSRSCCRAVLTRIPEGAADLRRSSARTRTRA